MKCILYLTRKENKGKNHIYVVVKLTNSFTQETVRIWKYEKTYEMSPDKSPQIHLTYQTSFSKILTLWKIMKLWKYLIFFWLFVQKSLFTVSSHYLFPNFLIFWSLNCSSPFVRIISFEYSKYYDTECPLNRWRRQDLVTATTSFISSW